MRLIVKPVQWGQRLAMGTRDGPATKPLRNQLCRTDAVTRYLPLRFYTDMGNTWLPLSNAHPAYIVVDGKGPQRAAQRHRHIVRSRATL